jgi:two-component system, OmpR family, sensor histidine kinase BaeS
MDNAVRHNPTGTSVAVRTWRSSRHAVTVTVADDGIGMPPHADHPDHGAPERAATSGAGLGLSITRAIVAAHNGTLRLERPGRGTRWHIELPVAPSDAGSESVTAVSTDGVSPDG